MADAISPTEPIWSREHPRMYWDPGRRLLSTIRTYQRWYAKQGLRARLITKSSALRHRFWSVVTGAEIPINTQIGGGLLIPHPNGIVIHPDAIIGCNCLIFQQVTIGKKGDGVPIVGGHVDIGAGAKVLGSVKIEDHVSIGANAVVINDVGEGASVVGIPAKPLYRSVS